MKTFTLSLFILLIHIFGYSQNYYEGCIFTNDNDTIYGLINFATDNLNAKRCKFKKTEKDKEMTFFPGDIKGYKFESGKYYTSKKIYLNDQEQHIFLEYLLQGMVNLYYYSDRSDYFLFEKEDGSMDIVTSEPERIENNKIISDNAYQNRLRFIFRDCFPVAMNAENVKFNQTEMIHITKVYHDNMCTTGEECIIFESNDPDKSYFQMKYSVYVGLQQSQYIFRKNNKEFTGENYSPAIGVQLNVLYPRWSKSFSLQADFSFSEFKKTDVCMKM